MRTLGFVLILVACPNLATAALVFGHAGQNLVRDTESGLIWLPPTASADEVEALGSFGRGLRVASTGEVNDLLRNRLSIPFISAEEQTIDPQTLQFFEFAASGSNDPLGGVSLEFPGSSITEGFFAWADDGNVPSPVDSSNFTGYIVGYGGLDAPPGDMDGLWELAYTVTLGTYPIEPCDTDFFSACTTSAFRVMTPVPLPGALPLLVTALAAGGFLGRRS